MATRNRTNEFVASRDRAHRAGSAGSARPTGPETPLWQVHATEVDRILAKIAPAIREMEIQQEGRLVPRFDLDDSEDQRLDKVVADETGKVVGLLRQAEARIKLLSEQIPRQPDPHAQTVVRNCAQAKITVLKSLADSFKKSQRTFTETLRRNDGYGEPDHVITVRESNEDNPLGQQLLTQATASDVDVAEMQDRGQRITHLASDVTTLATLFKDLDGMVLDQGEMLDRIDVQIDNTVQHVKAGTKDLVQAEKYNRGCKSTICILLLLLLIIIFSIIIGVDRDQKS